MQRSDSFLLNALLSFSGGLQDAYTFNIRDGVFANAQTGNVVLLSQFAFSRNWVEALDYLVPVLAFIAGTLTADIVENLFKFRKPIHWRQIVIGVEIVLLVIVGFIPEEEHEMLPNLIVSFSCAMQVHSFRTVRGVKYASTMCIGNIRSATESLHRAILTREKRTFLDALKLFGVILCFALGAGTGGLLTCVMRKETIWVSAAILLVVQLMMFEKEKKEG